MIFVIDDDHTMAECVGKATKKKYHIFHNAFDAIARLDNELPEIIFLDILLDGPDGFTFLNEVASYEDTNTIPIVIVTSLSIEADLKNYNVIAILKKDEMTPQMIRELVEKYEK